MTPYGLQTEQRTEPLGVDEQRPRLSWKLRSDRAGAAQSAYRITAFDGTEPVWDTGRRESAETLLIAWDGPDLRPATRYRWSVEVWDETVQADDVTDEQRSAIEKKLDDSPEVANFIYESKQEAYERFKQQFSFLLRHSHPSLTTS